MSKINKTQFFPKKMKNQRFQDFQLTQSVFKFSPFKIELYCNIIKNMRLNL